MNKGLEAFKRLVGWFGLPTETTPRQLCYEDKELVEKELKALEIIKNKQVQVAILSLSNSCVGYNMTRGLLGEYLTEEEYDFLKEVLYDR